jgi:glycosyltransferase involved in cell wall biosynthesis
MHNGNKTVVSVVIPNYNHAKYLKQRIDSVLNQTYQHFEVIILDDRSTDNSVQVIEAYRNHPKVSHIIVNEKNSGSPFLQWEKGIALSKGDWIWVAESDDWCEPVFLEELITKVNDGISFAFCQTIVINQDEKRILQTNWPYEEELINGGDFIRRYLIGGGYIVNASMCIFRKKYFREVLHDFTRYKFIGDWVLWHRMAILGKALVSGKQLNYFRKHDADVSGNAYRQGLVYTEYFTFLDGLENDKILLFLDRKKAVRIRFYEFLNDDRVEEQYRKKIKLIFLSKLGIKFYLFIIKNWLRKKIKRPLFNLLGIKRRQFQNFTR